uniref:DNA repair protein RadC n=1 Tax=Candidatus Kentrum sp. FM TaxID=2126340 RepID=A0A450T6Q0_9GAMM|nr:MAG: DNA repair protein RadC [Candidatus Kentron sp. FM]VFJ62208.1 MAG: DNA repair protein RadC [Candidatus Kentron sp. FM]VFK15056.1 MAG: DNA repair protein RadC [Candidatus Kentron sp. FM]
MDVKLTERDRIKVVNSDDVFAIMRKILLRENKIDQEKEHLWVAGLATNNRLLFIELVALGGAYSASVKPMEVFRVAVQKNASNVILVHNHPNEILLPSDVDKDLTDHFIQVGRILNVQLIEHLIISTHTFFSFAINGLIEDLGKSLKYVPPYEIIERIRAEEARIREEVARDSKREGKEEGMREGLKMGRDEGLEMGKEEGLQEGEKKGERKKAIEIARALLNKGMDIGEISEISGLSEEEIRELSTS